MDCLKRFLWPYVIFLTGVILMASAVSMSFDKYVKIFNKPYKFNSSEYHLRNKHFQESLRRIEKLNKQSTNNNASAKYGITKFSDLSQEEFRNKVLNLDSNKKNFIVKPLLDSNFARSFVSADYSKSILPKQVDWRKKGAMTAVKNQKNCGACWAFSIVETMESMNWIKKNELSEMSVQQVIDCVKEGEYGCNGGPICDVLIWMIKTNFNLTTEVKYPLTDVFGKCLYVRSSKDIQLAENFTCSNYVNKEDVMTQLLAFHGPIVTAVDATTWQDYLGGIIQFHCDKRVNHAVQIVGYDFTGSVPYYIVRNSWGADFGLNGYLHIATGKNLCGIAEIVASLDVK